MSTHKTDKDLLRSEFNNNHKSKIISLNIKDIMLIAYIINGIKRISKPGLRTYAKVDAIPRVLNGLGIAIISTSQGMMTDRDARKNHAGGEVVAYVW